MVRLVADGISASISSEVSSTVWARSALKGVAHVEVE